MNNPSRICVCYIITAFIITAFVYSLVSTHFSSITKLERLQIDVEEITKIILGRNPDDALLPQIDTYVKKRTQGLWDELVSIKKSLELFDGGCGFFKEAPKDVQAVSQEEKNYALKSIGAIVRTVDDEPVVPTGVLLSLFGVKYKSNFPIDMLDPSMQPGSCYAYKGNKTIFTIRLTHKIYIRAVTVEHISASASFTGDISNAPKDFTVYGVAGFKSKINDDVLLGSFAYNNSLSKRAQTFYFDNENSYRYCKIKVTSNYGNPMQTCIYRVAVHGKLE